MPARSVEAGWSGAQLDEVFWRGLFDIHVDPLAFVDTRYRIVRANRALAAALGCRTDDLVGRLCHEALNGSMCESCPHTLLLSDGCAHASELSLGRLCGCFWVSVTPVFDDSGQLLGSLHIARNVTAYKELEANLRAARDEVEVRAVAQARELNEHLQFQRLLVVSALSLSRALSDAEVAESIRSVVANFGEAEGFGCCVFWRVAEGHARAWARYEAASQRLLPELADEVDRNAVPCIFTATERSEVVHDRIGDFTCCAVGLPPLRPGDAAYVLLAVTRVSVSSSWVAVTGERMRLLCQIMGDVLRQHAAALETQMLREHLARLDQLARMSQLSAALAHELNQPLAATLCNAQAASRLLAESPPDLAEVRSALDDIVMSARRAGDVMQQTRALYRGDRQFRQEVDLCGLVNGVVTLLREDIALGNADVKCRFKNAPLRVEGDPVQLQQVLINLIKNAIDAVRCRPVGERRICIDLLETEERAVALSVSDNGCGLPDGGAESIFVPFRSGKAEGMGMGLPICRQIVTQHGGTLSASRPRGGGACLTVVLPRLA